MTQRIISEEQLKELLTAREILTRLYNGGVTSWDWYGNALNHPEDGDFDVYQPDLSLFPVTEALDAAP